LAPDALNPLVVDLPALPPQKSCNATVAVTAVLPSQPNNSTPQSLLVAPGNWNMSLSGSRLTDNPAGTPLRNTQLRPQVINALPASGGA
jgi:hypothetical protein